MIYGLRIRDTKSQRANPFRVHYSYESPYIFRNGCWLIKQGQYWYACDQDGDKISGVYGDTVTLLNDGRWKCVRNGYVWYEEN